MAKVNKVNCQRKCGKPMWMRLHKSAPPSPPEPPLGYGLLYNWYAATDVRGIAPDGWRVPSSSDYSALLANFGDEAAASIAIKGSRIISLNGHPGWGDDNNGTNSSAFNLYGYGVRNGDGTYSFQITQGFDTYNFTRMGTTEVFAGTLTKDLSVTDVGTQNDVTSTRMFGRPIRCLRDTAPPSPTVQDVDGNIYTWVQIGAQYWLAQNLKTTKYNNGDLIPTGLDNAAWAATTAGAWAYPNGDPTLPI